jgi:glycosyltransferase involved in cell wall biosynthesis
MPKIYNQYAVYVICSHYEGNPKTLLEAMACGSAVIGVRSPGIREIIEDKINGILVAENSVELRNTIQELIINKTLQKDIGQQARKYIIGGYSLESAVNKEYISYCELLEGLSDTL